ncbi:hypothetical protein NOK64_26900, partial [Vibrio parahaemolyticus]|uniref:hypothetical protein n=1 Tax=Vibrio parahaemolyticus TaxID=670 RepID=UPI00226AFD63
PAKWQPLKSERYKAYFCFIADNRELKTKTVVSYRVLSTNKTYTNYRFHVESYFPIFILGRLSYSKVSSDCVINKAHSQT